MLPVIGAFSNTRPLIAEVLQWQGRYKEAISFAVAELQADFNMNAASKVRAGRVLGCCHAAIGAEPDTEQIPLVSEPNKRIVLRDFDFFCSHSMLRLPKNILDFSFNVAVHAFQPQIAHAQSLPMSLVLPSDLDVEFLQGALKNVKT